MKDKIYKILDYNLTGSYEIKQQCVEEILRLFNVSGSLLAPTLDKRLLFAEELVANIDGDMPVSVILATTYWMQAEMINLNK